MIYSKISHGYVAQSYDSETGDCVEQTFVADGRVERLDVNGEPIPEDQIEDSVIPRRNVRWIWSSHKLNVTQSDCQATSGAHHL